MDWAKAKPEMVNKIVQEGEAYLSGQLKLATSADQRASMLAGVFTAAATAVIAGLLTLNTSDIPLGEKFPIYLGGGVAFVSFLAAASLCIMAIFPVGFWLPGNEPASWYGDVNSEKELTPALGEEAEHIQSKISENRAVLEKNAKRFRWGAILGIAAPIAGTLAWFISFFSVWIAR